MWEQFCDATCWVGCRPLNSISDGLHYAANLPCAIEDLLGGNTKHPETGTAAAKHQAAGVSPARPW